jgi:ferric enterobactin receptor
MVKSITRAITKLSFIVLLGAAATSSLAQGKAIVKGRVVDSLSSSPLSYTTIAIYSSPERKLINGNISDDKGDFAVDVPFGRYVAEVNFVGFNVFKSPEFDVTKENAVHDLGQIPLGPDVEMLDAVVVQAEKSTMELSLDKKIFNVGKDLANSGGTASDILMNIPSVSVDPEGNIKLRGSDNVRILIDGKPSGLVSFKGGSGLQQLQGSMIERVEVVTNPSARYEAEGLGGIINIVLKKEKNQGFNGSIDFISGYPANYGMAANLNYRHKKINFFINYSLAFRDLPGRGKLYQEVRRRDSLFILQQSNEGSIRGLNNNIRGGLDFYANDKNIFTASYLFRRADVYRVTHILYDDFLNSTSNMMSRTTRRQDEDEIEPNSEYSLIYKRIFKGKKHELLTEVKLLDNWEQSSQTFTQHYFNPAGVEDLAKAVLQKSPNKESEKQLLLQIDYTKLFAKDGVFETGFRTSSRNMVNDYLVTQQNASGGFDPLPGLDNIFYYDENITAAYGVVGNKTNRISYQAGMRAEWTDIKTTLEKTNESNPRKYSNLFPSAHLTYSLPKENSLQVSYSRRVRRPFYNDLSPFMTYSDSRNYFSGNPDLNPEFSHVSEIGHIKYFESGSISSSLYNRNTKDRIDNIRSVDSVGNAFNRPMNLLSENAFGLEVTGSVTVAKWWKADANFNFFYAEIDGSNIQDSYKTNTYSWFARHTSRFSLPKKFDIQVRTNYEAAQKTAQGRRKALYYADLSFSKEIFKGKGTLNLNILDVFNSRIMRSVSRGDTPFTDANTGAASIQTFYTDREMQMRRRQINLTLNYRIKQTKSTRPKKGEETVEGF